MNFFLSAMAKMLKALTKYDIPTATHPTSNASKRRSVFRPSPGFFPGQIAKEAILDEEDSTTLILWFFKNVSKIHRVSSCQLQMKQKATERHKMTSLMTPQLGSLTTPFIFLFLTTLY